MKSRCEVLVVWYGHELGWKSGYEYVGPCEHRPGFGVVLIKRGVFAGCTAVYAEDRIRVID